MKNILYKELSQKILGMAFNVHNILGPGLLESVYEGAIAVELKYSGIPFCRQKVYPVYYKGELVSRYIADIVVNNSLILEVKSVKELNSCMEAQLINYLKISGIELGYLINFRNLRVEWKRFVSQRPTSCF
jgi:GxxExxY protein